MPTPEHRRGLERIYATAPTNQRYTDLRLVIGEGVATLTVTATPDMQHAAGGMHGAHYFKLLDDAAFFAVNGMVPEVFVLTAQFSVQLFRPVAEGALRAEGRVTKPGRNLWFAESVLYGPDGKELGRGHGSFALSKALLVEMPGYLAP